MLLAGIGLLGPLVSEKAVAQSPYSPYSRPAYSPYLNLLRTGALPGINYYGLVRPELDFRIGLGQLQLQANQTQQALTDLRGLSGTPISGTLAGFQTQGIYFNNVGTGGGPAGIGPEPAGGAAAARFGALAGAAPGAALQRPGFGGGTAPPPRGGGRGR
jgi:hypothetical protein